MRSRMFIAAVAALSLAACGTADTLEDAADAPDGSAADQPANEGDGAPTTSPSPTASASPSASETVSEAESPTPTETETAVEGRTPHPSAALASLVVNGETYELAWACRTPSPDEGHWAIMSGAYTDGFRIANDRGPTVGHLLNRFQLDDGTPPAETRDWDETVEGDERVIISDDLGGDAVEWRTPADVMVLPPCDEV